MGKSLFKSKTFWVNLLVVVIATLTALSDVSLTPEYIAFFGILIGSGNIILRTITKEPIKGTNETS